MERIRKQLLEFKAQLQQTLSARDANITKAAAALEEEEVNSKTATEQLGKNLEEQLQAHEAATQEQKKQAEERRRRRINRVKNTCARLTGRFESHLQARLASWKDKQEEIHARVDKERQQKAAAVKKKCAEELERLAAFEKSGEELGGRIADFAREHWVRLDAQLFKESVKDIATEDETVAREITQLLERTGQELDLYRRSFKKRTPFLFPSGVVALLHAAAWGCFCRFATNSWGVLLIAVSLAVCMAVICAIFVAARERVYAVGMDLCRNLNLVGALLERQTQVLERGLTQAISGLDAARGEQVFEVDSEVERQTEEKEGLVAEITERLQACRDKLIAKSARDKNAELIPVGKQAEETAARLRAQNEEALEQRRAQYAARKREIEEGRDKEHARLAAQWGRILAECGVFAKETLEQARREQPPWRQLAEHGCTLPAAFRTEVCIGEVRVNLRGLVPECDAEGKFTIPPDAVLELPVMLTFPLEGSLCVRAKLARREQAMQTLFGAVLRLLYSCPPSKAKLTILDPVGLGQSFSALMHLADYDESLVGGRIWCETPHIEARLSELSQHLEKVIQKYLRNRYKTIDEYNREAGQLAEPYRFLVIADFPTGFSELAIERLASIITSGVKCGVYTLILHDARQALPASLDDTHFRRNGCLIAEDEEGFVVLDEALNRGAFSSAEPPSSEHLDVLVNNIGKQCSEAMRVQVPFESAAPKVEEYWSQSSITSIRLPLGKSGADRLQYLELGKNVSQHALIAGKTGSGKSNLFHVIITNASLWYSPKEVEFYLIDFKKGVEFKTYGVHRLAHARVVAIESDREF
ncbi:MAG: FtsK/SpoIIIE domain-containing protein, partial [Planctomycetota bacterium]